MIKLIIFAESKDGLQEAVFAEDHEMELSVEKSKTTTLKEKMATCSKIVYSHIKTTDWNKGTLPNAWVVTHHSGQSGNFRIPSNNRSTIKRLTGEEC